MNNERLIWHAGKNVGGSTQFLVQDVFMSFICSNWGR